MVLETNGIPQNPPPPPPTQAVPVVTYCPPSLLSEGLSPTPSGGDVILTKAAAGVESSSKCQKFYPVLYGDVTMDYNISLFHNRSRV